MAKHVNYAELQIGLHCHQPELYDVELRFSNPASEAEVAPVRGVTSIVPQDFLALQLRPQDYGQALASSLFAAPEVAKMYASVKASVESSDQFLRVRLWVGPEASELHTLRWELLADPETKQPLATTEKILLSRFGASNDWRPVRLRPKSGLRALVAVSAPSNPEKYQLAPVDRDGEIARARDHLKGIQVTVVGDDAPLSLNRLIDGLRDKIDILYLVCHGALVPKGGPTLYLQNETGEASVTKGDELAQRIGELTERPRLVMLASCESAGSERVSTQDQITAGQLVPLAPLLAQAGVPAVLAMQGKISMETVKRAMPVFFAELLKDGQIDRALAVARGSVRERPDSWMPALFLRLKGGKIWYEPGFGEGEGDFAKWQALVHAVRSGQFTPIVGSELGERVYGKLGDAAHEIAEEVGFPLAEHQRSELPLVSQYLRVSQSDIFARDRFKDQLRKQIVAKHHTLPAEHKRASLPNLLREVGKRNRDGDPADRYKTPGPAPGAYLHQCQPRHAAPGGNQGHG
jgi:CHAT domain